MFRFFKAQIMYRYWTLDNDPYGQKTLRSATPRRPLTASAPKIRET